MLHDYDSTPVPLKTFWMTEKNSLSLFFAGDDYYCYKIESEVKHHKWILENN